MTVELRPDTHHLRLDRDTFHRIVDWLTGDHPDDPLRTRLHAAGVLDDRDGIHPALAGGFDAVLNPICRLLVRVGDPQGQLERSDGWLSADAAALLLDLPGGRCEFGTLLPAFVPVMLARIVQLGPRPRLGTEPRQATPELVEQLTDPDPARREAAARELGHESLAGTCRDWRVQASWNAADGTAGVRALRALDTPAGMWMVEPHRERVVLFPTTPTAVWYTLVRLLPTDTELPLP